VISGLVLGLLVAVAADRDEDEPRQSVIAAVRPILEQRPAEAKRLLQRYDFDAAGHSPHIGGDKVHPGLRGRRIGPYTLYARPKGSGGAARCKVIVKTEIQYWDAKGQSTDVFRAASVTELLRDVSFVDLEAPDARLFGSWRTERIEGPWKRSLKSIHWQLREDLTLSAVYSTPEGDKTTEGHFEMTHGKLLFGSREGNTWGLADVFIESANRFRLTQDNMAGDASVWFFRRE